MSCYQKKKRVVVEELLMDIDIDIDINGNIDGLYKKAHTYGNGSD